MYQVSVKHPGDADFTMLGTFPSYSLARASVFDGVALCGGHNAGYSYHGDNYGSLLDTPVKSEIMIITADKEVVEYTITRHSNDNS